MKLSNGERLFCWPLNYHVITAGWTYRDGSAHNANDYRTNQSGSIIKPVYAAEDATVDQVQTWDGHTKTGMQSYGNMVRIRHADYSGKTLQTRYAHLSSCCVAQGERVEEGQLIGYTGQTGNVYGAHLHFEVIWDGVRRNPLVWLDEDFTLATGSEETVALTAENNGPHTHVENFTYSLGVRPVASEAVGDGSGKYFSAENQGSAGPSKYVSTAESGGGEPHNNMPPYKAFFMWQRTA